MIPVSDWLPDQPVFNGSAGEALNVIPRARSYGPFASFQAYSTNGLTARAQGGGAYRAPNNTIGHYAGDANKLYRLTNGTSWVDASAYPYSTGTDEQWRFAQFGPLVIAVNGFNPPQKVQIANNGNFADLGGSPPIAKYIAIVRDFLFLANLSTDAQSVQWSAINNAESWVIGTNQADIQPIPDGGWIQGIVGGEFALIFSEFAINRFTYIGGSVIFQRDQIASGIGASIPGTVTGFGDRAFCAHRTGFYMIVGGQEIRPIGAERVNNYFWQNINTSFLYRVTSSIDPENNVYVVSFPNNSSTDGTPNELLIYNWVTDKWSHVLPGNHEIIYNALTAKQWSLEDIGAVYPDIDQLPYSLDSTIWSGTGRLLLGSFDINHKGTLANGPTLQAIVDSTEFQPIDGERSFLRSARPLIEGSSAIIAMKSGIRNHLYQAVDWSSNLSINLSGKASMRRNARYHRLRIKVAYGSQWNHILGIDDLGIGKAGTR